MPGHHRNNHRQDPTAATKATPCRTLPIVFPTIGRFLFGEERESAHPSTRSGNGSARAGLLRPRPPCGSTSLHIHRKAGIAGRPPGSLSMCLQSFHSVRSLPDQSRAADSLPLPRVLTNRGCSSPHSVDRPIKTKTGKIPESVKGSTRRLIRPLPLHLQE